LTSDIIVGFPGETSEDFEATRRLIEHCRFDAIYIFKYSERPGTPAAGLENTVSDNEKASRFLALEQSQRIIQNEIYADYVGTEVSVLVERRSAKSESDMSGHTTCNKVVNFPAGEDLKGQIVSVRVNAAKANSLFGELV
jgi:tRNA-2-methylthio-N6-dimethylallyladenosine synthase